MNAVPTRPAGEAGAHLHADMLATVSRLFIYPVKSCAGIALGSAELTEAGLALDRAWMVVDEDGEFLSQRELPRMALIQPELTATQLVLRAPGMPVLALPIVLRGAPRRVQVWRDLVAAHDQGGEAARWFSDFLGRPAALVRFAPGQSRLSDMKWTGGRAVPNLFSDGFPVLVASEAALDEFNQGLAGAGHAPVGMERFRPNLVLAGVDAHAEDHLGLLQIGHGEGAIRLQLVKPCARCSIPNVDPATAESSPAVTEALMRTRRDPRLDGALTWGMNAMLLGGAGQRLQVGDTVQAMYLFE